MTRDGSRQITRLDVMGHHLLCAYVGPLSDFGGEGETRTCPKCRRAPRSDGLDWEIMQVESITQAG